jgi:indolepyruvate ferredoxin oxidoreductase beta subunit
MTDRVTNVVIAGLGGQGVLTAADILAEAAFGAGGEVKMSALHGLSQRGGAVTSDVRFGVQVFSPMVTAGEADYLVVLAAAQVASNRTWLKAEGTLLAPQAVDESVLPDKRTLNVALLGVLSVYLDLGVTLWQDAIRGHLAPRFHEANLQAFDLGRAAGRRARGA